MTIHTCMHTYIHTIHTFTDLSMLWNVNEADAPLVTGMHVCVYVCMYVCIRAHVHIQKNVCMCVCVNAFVCKCTVYVCMNVNDADAPLVTGMHVCVYVCMYACMYV